MRFAKLVMAASFVLVAGTSAQAQSMGERVYLDRCAHCHGASAMGGGPLAPHLISTPPDLTNIQADNGGVFPVVDVVRIIEGSSTPTAHGTREMPAWGSFSTRRAVIAAEPDYEDQVAQTYSRFLILTLVEYLASIQRDD